MKQIWNEMEWNRNKSRIGIEQNRNGIEQNMNEMEYEYNGNDLEWNRNGMKQEWNKNGIIITIGMQCHLPCSRSKSNAINFFPS